MDDLYAQHIAELGVELGKMAVKGIASAVRKRVKVIKNEKNIEDIRNAYDEIISELLTEREEAVHIAQEYRSEVERINISEEDIKHLQATITKALDIFKKFGEFDENDQLNSFEQIKELITVDTLKTMQLLGFNYKAAIGEPLTEICAQAIRNLGPKGNKNKSIKK